MAFSSLKMTYGICGIELVYHMDFYPLCYDQDVLCRTFLFPTPLTLKNQRLYCDTY